MTEVTVKSLKVEGIVQPDGRVDVRIKLNDTAWRYVPNQGSEVLQRIADIYKEVYDNARKANRKVISPTRES